MKKTQHRKPRSAGKKTAALLALLALSALAVGLTARSSFPRLEVCGFRVMEQEYLRAMYRARNEVLSDHAAAGISLTDWETETALGDPRRLTMDRALELLREYYAVSTLAVERGYLTDASFAAMVDSMEQVNAQRQEALEAGAMVTGIPVFTMDDYLSYRSLNLKLQFCNDPANPEFQVTDEELRQRYEADRDSLYRQPDVMELAFLLADGADDSLERDFRRALELGELTAALAELPHLTPYYREISVTPATYGFHARSHGDVLVWAAGLQPGELSQVIRQEDRLCLIQCRGRTSHQYVPLAEVESVILQSIRESRYDALIAGRMERMEVSGNLQSLYRFTAKQFHW